MLVGQGVVGLVSLGHGIQDLLAHLVHGVLDRRALVLGKSLERDVAGRLPRLVEALNALLHLGQVGELLPGPAGVHVGGQDAVPRLLEGGELVPHEAVEGGAGALEHLQADDAALEEDALPGNGGLDVAGLLAVAQEAVGVGLAVDGHARPAVDRHVDVGGADVGVLVEEMAAQDAGVQLRGVDGVLLGLDVDGVLDGVGSNHDAVVGLGVRGLDLALEKAADRHLGDRLLARLRILVDLVDADIVLAVASSRKASHLLVVGFGSNWERHVVWKRGFSARRWRRTTGICGDWDLRICNGVKLWERNLVQAS